MIEQAATVKFHSGTFDPQIKGYPAWLAVVTFTSAKAARPLSLFRPLPLGPSQVAAVRHELFLLLGWSLMLWIIGAASVSGFILTAFFCLLAIARVLRISLLGVIERMPKHSAGRHYATLTLELAFFLIVILRACYISMAIVDTGGVSGGI